MKMMWSVWLSKRIVPTGFAVGILTATVSGGMNQVPATGADFFQPGTQPLNGGLPSGFEPLLSATSCAFCHSGYDPLAEPYELWSASMMGQSARDPLFAAQLTITNQEVAGGGEYCIRCHAPNAFLTTSPPPTDLSNFTPLHFEGVSCNFCHRLVDPEDPDMVSPVEDDAILAELDVQGWLPPNTSNARFVVDPHDTRRGPFDDVPFNLHTPAPILVSPFHQSSTLCWTCHDVSNPLMTEQGDGTYALNDLGMEHPTHEGVDMFPVHRTFSEWQNSWYNLLGGVQHFGRFGGNHPTGIMTSCQDCHMPDQESYGCNLTTSFPLRPDVPQHSFVGSNTWVLKAVRSVDAVDNVTGMAPPDGMPDFPDSVTGLTDASVDAAIARNTEMLELASDMQLSVFSQQLNVRIINETGHKLPTGFPDGRRMWINVQFYDCNDELILEHGAYDFETATLDHEDTTVFEAILGIEGEDYAADLGLPEGPTNRFVLANAILKDNRIPPRGFSNQIAAMNQTAPVGATYSNGQHWSDTLFEIPLQAKQVVATVYYQLVSREFIEFLRDENTSDNRGQIAYDLWEDPLIGNKSEPVIMDMIEQPLFVAADVNEDGLVDVFDILETLDSWGPCKFPPPGPCPGDATNDGQVDVFDILAILDLFGCGGKLK